jgi:hypothetical protein
LLLLIVGLFPLFILGFAPSALAGAISVTLWDIAKKSYAPWWLPVIAGAVMAALPFGFFAQDRPRNLSLEDFALFQPVAAYLCWRILRNMRRDLDEA